MQRLVRSCILAAYITLGLWGLLLMHGMVEGIMVRCPDAVFQANSCQSAGGMPSIADHLAMGRFFSQSNLVDVLSGLTTLLVVVGLFFSVLLFVSTNSLPAMHWRLRYRERGPDELFFQEKRSLYLWLRCLSLTASA